MGRALPHLSQTIYDMKHFNRRFLTITAATLMLMPAMGQKKGNVLDLKYSIEDSSIVYPESFETDTQKLLERWYLKNYTTAGITETGTDPGASDNEIRARLAALPTIIDMPFNSIVKSYIERYTKKGRKQLTALLGLSSYYMPIFEQALEQAGLPLELKYLPVIESGLDPTATSKSGAAGLWQFMPIAARGYDLELSTLVDERRDPYVSSESACRLLKDLYNAYGDWSLAIAAYNCGQGTVNKALKRAGGDASSHDFWSIYYYLPAETRGYVPAFIAANYVMTYYPEHGIAPVLLTKPLVTDTIHVSDRVHFEQIAAVLKIPVDEIRILNPQFRADIIPASASRPYNLILPSQQIHAYLVSEDQILAYESSKYARRTDATPGDSNVQPVEEDLSIMQVVAPDGETDILAYEQTPASQPATPTRRRTAAAASQPAPVNVSANTTPVKTNVAPTPAPAKTEKKKTETTAKQSAASTKKTTKETTANNTTKKTEKKKETATTTTKKNDKKKETAATTKKNNKPVEHSVSSGENLTTIAKKHGVSVEELKKANPKLKGDMIHPGDKLSVPKTAANNTKNNTKATTKKDNSSKSTTTQTKKKK